MLSSTSIKGLTYFFVSPLAGSHILWDLSTRNKIFAGTLFPVPGGSGFEFAILVAKKIKKTDINLKITKINLF